MPRDLTHKGSSKISVSSVIEFPQRLVKLLRFLAKNYILTGFVVWQYRLLNLQTGEDGVNALQRHLCCWPQTVSKPLVCQLTFLIRGYVKVSYFQIVFLVSSLSTKKRTKTNRQVVKSNFFVNFLEETLAWKNHFEINWPLKVRQFQNEFMKSSFVSKYEPKILGETMNS